MTWFTKKLYPNARRLLRDMGWAFKITWQASPWLTTSILIVELISSLLPAGQALAGRNVINAFTGALGQGSTEASTILRWLILLSALTLIDAMATLSINTMTDYLGNELNIKIPMLILDHAAKLDYPYFEDPRF